MSQVRIEASGLVDAPASEVYTLIADYHNGHPRILPAEHFKDLRVEKGGTGAGTIIRFSTIVAGRETPYHMEVVEPEPGHILVERDLTPGSSIKTTFTVDPLHNNEQARVTIVTEYEKGGVAGLIEKFLTPLVLRGVYQKELAQLATVAKAQ